MLKAKHTAYVTTSGAGISYSPMVRRWQEHTHVTRSMPNTIYTAVIVASMTADGWTDALVIVGPMVCLVLGTSVVQLTLCFYVFEAILDPYVGTSGSLETQCIPAEEGNSLLRK